MKTLLFSLLLSVFYLVLPAQNRSSVTANPAQIDETLNPNEFYVSVLTLTNNGSSSVDWNAELVNAGNWLSLDSVEGTLQPAGNTQLNVNLNAENLGSGDTLTGEIHFIFSPDSDTLVVPVNMLVSGDTLGKVKNLKVTFSDQAFGVVNLKWQLKILTSVYPQHYLIKRDGTVIGTSQYTVYYDSLPEFGSYSYEVIPVYSQGEGIKDGPKNIVWHEPQLVFSPDTVRSHAWINDFSMTRVVISNTGEGELYFEFTGFDDPDYTKDFVTSVVPYSGRIRNNGSIEVFITTSADGYVDGVYLADLPFTTNESNPDDTLYAEMSVTTPSVVYGAVSDCFNASPLFNVKVQAQKVDDSLIFTAYSDINGQYRFKADDGNYNLIFSRAGYRADTVDSVLLIANDSLVVNGQLCVEPCSAREVEAVVHEEEGLCSITWNKPIGNQQIVYDDDGAEDFLLFNTSGSAIAVRFTPDTYPAVVTGGMFYVGKGTETANKTGFYGSDVIVGVLDVDSTGMPGAILDTLNLTINNFGWIDFAGMFSTTITEGDFFIAVWQVSSGVEAVPVGLDAGSASNNRSYFRLSNTSWGLSLKQGMMIRAFVSGPIVYANSGFNRYLVYRVSGFEPNNGEFPQDGYGINEMIGNASDTSFTDNQYGALASGWYNYCVKAEYNSNVSAGRYSNIIQRGLDVTATVNVTHCGGKPSDSVFVTLTGHDYPNDVLQELSNSYGVALFDSVIKGVYDIKIFKIGYQPVILHDILINSDYTVDVAIQENAFPARNLYVDSITSIATWDEPLVTALPLETFEDTLFPPPGWQVFGEACDQWHRTDNISEPWGDWIVPAWEGHYALLNDDAMGSCSAGSLDYLMTPSVDLREKDYFSLIFDRYFDKEYGGIAAVEYSVDSGNTWIVINQLIPKNIWYQEVIDLSSFSGVNGLENVMFAFTFDDGYMGSWSDGFAVDNVQITSNPAVIKSYLVYLDGYQVATLPPDQRTYQFEDLQFGRYYTAAVRAGYSCGMSEKVEYAWQSGFVYPPRNLILDYTQNTSDIALKWNPPFDNTTQSVPEGLLSFNIYRNNDSLTNIPYEGQQPDEQIEYFDMDLFPGDYTYKITALYDLTHFGYPGETGESGPSNMDTVTVKWGYNLPFEETWEIPDFNYNSWYVDTNYWKINESVGNKAPSAMFVGDTTLDSGYAVSLSSVPFRGDKLDNELVYFDFDLRLDDLSSLGNEILKVELYDGNDWNTLTTIANTGSFGFNEGAYHFDITNETVGKIFRVRFTATGSNPVDAVWYVDNIKVYYKCKSPENLTGEYVWNNNGEEDKFAAKICWEAPEMPGGQIWIYWDQQENYSSTGLTDGGDFSVAARWEPDQISGLVNDCITEVSFYLADTGFDDIIVRIWKGTSASYLIYEQYVTGLVAAGQWDTIVLNTPVPIDVTEELWVGYTIVGQEPGKMPAGIDAGPAIAGYGDKITNDGLNWDNLSDLGLNYNWNIAARIEALPPEKITPLKPLIDDFIYSTPNASVVQGAVNVAENKSVRKSRGNELSLFKIYRSKTGEEGSYLNYATLPFEDGTALYCFEDKYPNVEPQQSYWYKVTAVWINDADTCESDFALAKDNPDDDFVYVMVTDVENHDIDNEIKLYPNPASSLLNIESSEAITLVAVYDYSGKSVYKQSLNGDNKLTINTGSFHAGVYVVRIKTGSREVFRRFVIVR